MKPDKNIAIRWADNNLVGKSIYHKDLKKYIQFTHQGIKHAISNNTNPVKIKLIYHAENLVKSSILIASRKDKKERKDIKMIHTLFNKIKLENRNYFIYIIVRECINGHIYYDHSAVEVKENPA